MTTITIDSTTFHPTGGQTSASPSRLACTPSSTVRQRTVLSRIHSAALAIWRLLPALSSSTPSDDVISTLSQSDRLGERR